MNKSAEISKDGRTLTVNTFKDLKHFLDRVRYKHFQITVDKPIKELIIKDSKTDLTVNYVTKILRNAALQTIESFEIISPSSDSTLPARFRLSHTAGVSLWLFLLSLYFSVQYRNSF